VIEMEYFDTKEDAEKYRQELLNKRYEIYCPIARYSCQSNCEALYKGRIAIHYDDPKTPKFIVRKPHCKAYLLKGD